CSVDQVARDVDARYEEAEQIGTEIRDAALGALATRMSRPGTIAFNPSPFEREGIPGLGWRLDPPHPRPEPEPVRLDGDGFEAGGFRFRLVDEGDRGDLYTFCPDDSLPPAGPALMRVEEGKLVATWPGLTVEAVASHTAIDAPVRLRLVAVNGRPDHRLRLHARLLEPAEGSWSMAPFEVVERPLRGQGGTETPSPTWPARQAALAGGVALFQEGVYEYEILPEPFELAVTLLRCVGTISQPQLATRAWAAGPDIAT